MTDGGLRPLLAAGALAEVAAGGEVAVPPSGVAPAVAAFAAARATTLVVTATTADAVRLRDDLEALLGDEAAVALWPGWDVHPLERVSPDLLAMGQRHALRWRLRHHPPTAVVAPVRAVAQLLPPEPLTPPLEVRRGATLDRDALVAELAGLGYRREPAVEHRGEFAVRGGIVDVWPASAHEPFRIDLFGDEVERVTAFDVADQRSVRDVERAEIFAAREWRPDAATRATALALADAMPWAAGPLGAIADGRLIDGMEGWLGFFADGRTVLDELPAGAAVAVVDPARTAARLGDLLAEERELADAVGRTWDASGELPLLHGAFADTVGRVRADLTIVGAPTGRSSIAPEVGAPPVVQGDPARLAALVRQWPRGRRGIVAAASGPSAAHIAGQLAAEGVEASAEPGAVLRVRVAVVVAPLARGFVLSQPDVVVWSETDLTGRRAVHRAPRARARRTDGFFDDLAIGGYVVHRQYGVARFLGSTSRAISGTVRDYLVLEFRDGRNYWPVDQIEALTPYTGGDAPALSRMGSEQWQRSRARAKAAATVVAQELLALYRARLLTPGHAFSPDTPWQREMESLFPYAETADQLTAINEVKADMEQPKPMDRLVCADVGFGKTEIAVRAIFKAVQDHKQAALLVPTTLLASQHFATVSERFSGFPVKVALLSRFVEDREAKETINGLRDGTVDVVIGTHRLLDEHVTFKDLGLLVVDEEQRFGVAHKEAIKARALGVDVLTLTANPIPRTLEMAFTGIRDLSMVMTPPADRQPILTHVGEYDERAVTEAVRRELLREGQVFYVHNRVADIDVVARRLAELVPDARIAIAHGQMDEGTLETVVDDFWQRRYDVLVCTTIVESGIDMPTVNTLIVDRADRLGLGQLHQLRGRVGRGGARAYAYLFYPGDKALSETAYERLRTIGDHTALGSGFKIAMRDLEIRGAGNLIGHDQSGPIAAVGYDLYVQLVAEAVNEAKGRPVVEAATVNLDVPGAAHLPTTYVAAEDERLEAYRRLGNATTTADLDDVAQEWADRYGPLPAAARSLLELAALRLECLRLGVREVAVQPVRAGVRSKPVLKASPLRLPLSAQLRVRRLHGSRAYDEGLAQLRVELEPSQVDPRSIAALLREIVPEPTGETEVDR